MKTLLILTTVILSLGSFAQTNIIAAKSHSFDLSETISERDNFGEYIPPRRIRKVKYLNEGCMVEVYRGGWNLAEDEYDTICNHPFLSKSTFDFERIQNMYPDETEFIDFHKIDRSLKKKITKGTPKKSAFSILSLLGILGIGILFSPRIIGRFS